MFPYYEGQLLDGMRHGKGVYNYANGDYYSGMWKFNLPDGLGTYVWNGGDYLECKWQAGVSFCCCSHVLACICRSICECVCVCRVKYIHMDYLIGYVHVS